MDNSIKIYTEILRMISKLSIIVIFIPIILAFLNRRYLNEKLKVINYYILIQFFVAIMLQLIYRAFGVFRIFFTPILNKLKIIDMSFMSIFSHISVFALLGWYFILIFKNNAFINFIRVLSIFLTASSIINYFFIEGYNVQSVYNSTMAAIFCIVFSLFHLWFIFNDIDSKVVLNRNSYYWINLGLLVPNIMALFMYFIGKKLEETDNSMFLLTNVISDIIQLLGFLLFSIGFYYARYTKYMPKATT